MYRYRYRVFRYRYSIGIGIGTGTSTGIGIGRYRANLIDGMVCEVLRSSLVRVVRLMKADGEIEVPAFCLAHGLDRLVHCQSILVRVDLAPIIDHRHVLVSQDVLCDVDWARHTRKPSVLELG